MIKFFKKKDVWIGIAIGTIIGPMVVSKVAPSVSKKLPS